MDRVWPYPLRSARHRSGFHDQDIGRATLMPSSIGRRGFLASGSFLACYGVLDRSKAAVPVRITPPVVDRLTIQAVVDTNHDIFISGEQAPGVGVERVRS